MSLELTIWAIYAVLTGIEIVVFSIKKPTHVYRIVALPLLFGNTFVHAWLLFNKPALFGVPFFVLGVFRCINIMRYIYGRMHATYLQSTVARTSLVLGLAQAATGVLASIAGRSFATKQSLYIYASVACGASIVLLYTTVRTFKRHTLQLPPGGLPLADAPTVTVAIPARNETQDLEACLRSVLASSYQKLEVLVLDDCSHDKTSDIIKSFAHDGVRFVQGSEPGESWLPKNAAYQKLANEASGDLLLFCGVDVRMGTHTIQDLVHYYTKNNLSMLSVMPTRQANAEPVSAVQILRYMWELSVPRRLMKRPPVLSTAWLISAKELHKRGGFLSVKRMIVPEAFFAKELSVSGTYKFISASAELQLESMKRISDQQHTMVRVRYPQLHKRPENVLLLTCIEGVIFILPAFLIISVWWHSSMLLLLLGAVSYTASSAASVYIIRKIQNQAIVTSVARSLIASILDLGLLYVSMYKYEFSSVEWKQRNVCMPVMHVTPHLPELPPN